MKLLTRSAGAFALLLSLNAFAQNGPSIMTIDGKPVSKTEFEAIFKKNNKETKVTREALDEYIELFVKFKLKVAEAERLGLDTSESFRNELEGYRKQLAKPYLTDNRLTEELIKEAYERMLSEVHARHILVKIGGAQTPEDTLRAWKRVMEARKKIEAGDNFASVAEMYSDDPSAKTNANGQGNGGDLGYFSGLLMVYPFESAAFNTPVGKISDPVRTSFGYHIIKVEDKRAARGEVKVAHILIPVLSGENAEKQKAAKDKINEIYQLVNSGSDFAELARKYSDDKQTAASGGVLPQFGTGKMIDGFEEASFALQKPGDVSQPFLISDGWHIVKLIEKKPVGSLEELRPTLVKRITRDDRSKMTKASFLKKIKAEYGFKEYTAQLKPIVKSMDTTFFTGTWKTPDTSKVKVLAEWNGEKVTVADFVKYVDGWKGKSGKPSDITTVINQMYAFYINDKLTSFEESRLEAKYPEFKALYKEYRDGILLFDLTNKMVWNKAVEDTVGLKAFYAQHSGEYMWKKRADAVIYKAKDKKIAEATIKLIKKGKTDEEILKAMNVETQLNLAVDAMVAEVGTNNLLDQFTWTPGVTAIKVIDGQQVFVNFKSVMETQPKKLEETRGAVTAAYQNYLEENWIKDLKARYKVQVNNDVLYSVQ